VRKGLKCEVEDGHIVAPVAEADVINIDFPMTPVPGDAIPGLDGVQLPDDALGPIVNRYTYCLLL
jgi:hypothetical protein